MDRSFRIVFFIGTLFVSVFPVNALESLSDPVLLLGEPAKARVLAGAVREAGGRPMVVVPEYGAVFADLDDRAFKNLATAGRFSTITRAALTSDEVLQLPAAARRAVKAWNEFVMEPAAGGAEAAAVGSPLDQDALEPPVWWDLPAPGGAQDLGRSPGSRPAGAAYDNTSEYLAGSVSLNLVLLESDGSVDTSTENWTEALENQVLSEAIAAGVDLATMYPDSDLTFVIHPYNGRTDGRASTGYEPITRGAMAGEDLWGMEVLANFGYTDASRFTRSRKFADDTRMNDGTDWAINIFVINSVVDADGKFTDGYFAYAWLGGPHIVMTTDNDGWGIANFNMVTRHEVHHSFFALDEYSSSACTCTATAGYLNGTNDNCEACNAEAVACVMIANSANSCEFTHRQVGTIDTDSDGTPDILDMAPLITLQVTGGAQDCSGQLQLSGRATVVPVTNQNPKLYTTRSNITLLKVSDVEIQVDGGDWQSGLVTAVDGTFDSTVEDFQVTLALGEGQHSIRARSLDTRQNQANDVIVNVYTYEAATAVGPTLMATRQGASIRLDWEAASGAQTYNIRRATTPSAVSGSTPLTSVASLITWTDNNPPSNAFYTITAVNACGTEVP